MAVVAANAVMYKWDSPPDQEENPTWGETLLSLSLPVAGETSQCLNDFEKIGDPVSHYYKYFASDPMPIDKYTAWGIVLEERDAESMVCTSATHRRWMA